MSLPFLFKNTHNFKQSQHSAMQNIDIAGSYARAEARFSGVDGFDDVFVDEFDEFDKYSNISGKHSDKAPSQSRIHLEFQTIQP
mgnify:CR=1 FL=1